MICHNPTPILIASKNSIIIKSNSMQTANNKYQEMEITKLFPSPTNPRKHFNETKLDELKKSIVISGVQEPLIIRHAPEIGQFVTGLETGYPEYEIVAGERRYRASLLAEKSTVPVLIKELTDEQVMEIQAIENLQREDVNLVDQADAFKLWIDIYLKEHSSDKNVDYDVALMDLSNKIGKSVSWITKVMKLSDLVDAAKQMVVDEKISIQHAVHIARLPKKDQEECVRYCKQNQPSVDGLVYFIQNRLVRNLNKAPFSTTDPKLVEAAGACITCSKRSGANQTLFNDIQSKDLCFDSNCYSVKLQNFVLNKIIELTEKGEEYKLILDYSHDSYPSQFKGKIYDGPRKILYNSSYNCEYMIKGVYVSEDEYGQIVNICINKECKKHFGRTERAGVSSGNRLPEDPKKKFEVKIKRGRELDIEKVYSRAQESFKDGKKFISELKRTTLSKVEWALFLWSFFDQEHSYHSSDLLEKASPALYKKIRGRDTETPDAFLKVWMSLTDAETAMLFRCIFIGQYYNQAIQHNYDSSKAIYLFARDHGVDVKKFEQEQAEIAKKRESNAQKLMEREKAEQSAKKKKPSESKKKATA